MPNCVVFGLYIWCVMSLIECVSSSGVSDELYTSLGFRCSCSIDVRHDILRYSPNIHTVTVVGMMIKKLYWARSRISILQKSIISVVIVD